MCTILQCYTRCCWEKLFTDLQLFVRHNITKEWLKIVASLWIGKVIKIWIEEPNTRIHACNKSNNKLGRDNFSNNIRCLLLLDTLYNVTRLMWSLWDQKFVITLNHFGMLRYVFKEFMSKFLFSDSIRPKIVFVITFQLSYFFDLSIK